MIIQVGDHQVEVDDSFKEKTANEQNEIVGHITTQLQPQTTKVEDAGKAYAENKANVTGAAASGIIGGATGLLGGAAVESAAKRILPQSFEQAAGAQRKFASPSDVAERAAAARNAAIRPAGPVALDELGRKVPGGSGTWNYARVMPGDPIPERLVQTVEDMTTGKNPRGLGAGDVAAKNAENIAKLKSMGLGGYQLTGSGLDQLALSPETAAARQADLARQAQASQEEINRAAQLRAQRLAGLEASKASQLDQFKRAMVNPVNAAKQVNLATGQVLTDTTAPRLMKWGLRGLTGVGAGMGAAEAAQHFGKGEYGRGIVSGLGAVGDLATMSRHPIAMPLGMVAGIGAPILNTYLDKLVKENPKLAKYGLKDGGQPKKSLASIAGTLQSVGTRQGPNLSTMARDYINELPTKTMANLGQQRQDIDNALSMGNQGINIADKDAFNRVMDQSIGLMGSTATPSLSQLLEMIKQQGGSAAAQRLERAADLVPNLEHQFQPQALKSAFTGDNASAVMVMKPSDFEKYATPIPNKTSSPNFKNFEGSYQEYLDYLGKFIKPNSGFSSVPFLSLGKTSERVFPKIEGHEGRHRTAALEKLNNQSTLIQMMPSGDLREPLPRRSQQEYLNALIKQIGNEPMVTPQKTSQGETRGLTKLPELFKKGGLT
jgi:hypothetical protein